VTAPDPRDLALQVECWCGARAGEPCQGRPGLRRGQVRLRRSLHHWRYCKAVQPAWNLPGRPITLMGAARPLGASQGAAAAQS
jgi:hypothetical protein